MKARDVIGRTIVGVAQERMATRESGDGRELEHRWVVTGFKLDNGARLMVMAIETDLDPAVVAWVDR